MSELQGQNVVVTGGSRGLGEKIAEAFAAEGARVLVVARTAEKLEVVAQRIGGSALVADLGSTDGVDNLFTRCLDELGHIDVWVNNAGIETSDAFMNTPRAVVRNLLRVNLEATMLLTQDVAAHMLERGSGHIVQISSVAGAMPFPGLTAYAGSKAGITHFTESLRVELAHTDIEFTVVAPGPVDTEMWDRLDVDGSYQAPALKRFRQLQFLPKLDPEKVAKATVQAVINKKRFVRMPARFAAYHMLNNAPRRMLEAALVGVKLPLDHANNS